MNSINTIMKRKYTRLYNHSGSSISIPLYVPDNRTTKGTMVEGKNGDDFGYVDVTWDDICYINDKTSVFKNGSLRFSSEDEKAIYEELNILDWKDILFEETIDDIIMKPTKEKLQKIIDIKDIFIMDRTRGRLNYLMNTGADISTKTIDVINERFKEFNRNQKVSNITLAAKEAVKPADEKEVDKLKDEVAALKAMVEQFTKKEQ